MNKTKLKLFYAFLTVAFCLTLALGTFCDLDFSAKEQTAFAATAAESYYSSLEDETTQGSEFRKKLADLLKKTHTHQTSYADLADVYPQSDADPNKSGNIIWFYTGTSASFRGDFNSGTNREHVWPKNGGKAFPENSQAGSDAHHLRPCNDNLNSTRGSYGYDEVPQTPGNIVKENGSTSYANLCYLADGTFYPGKGYRGATARILMYVQTRWGTEFNLKFVDGQGGNKTIGSISTLMKWHLEEPPTEEEYRRNEAVYKIQGNRNPFIDHPEYASRIYCYDGESYNSALQTVVNTYGDYEGTDVESIAFDSSETTVAIGESVTLEPVVTPSSAATNVFWTSSDSSVATVANGTVKGLKQGTATVTATAGNDSAIKASITIKVIGVSSVTVSGTPTKKTYFAGEKFSPAGLSVSATYSDGSTKSLSPQSLTWLDANTRTETLREGTTSVILSFCGIEKTVSGITVKAATSKSVSFGRDEVSGGSAYGWNGWTAGDITGKVYSYPGNKSQIQMNNSKGKQCYMFNDKALTGGLLTITMKVSAGKKWELKTSKTPFDTSANPYPTTGTSHGEKTSDSNGITWTVSTTDEYFAICYKDSGVVYLDSVTITYGAAQEEECTHTFGEWQTVKEATETEEGQEKRTCTKCGEEETRTTAKLECTHTFGEWQTVKEATETEEGQEKRTCSKCGEEETRTTAKLEAGTDFKKAVDAVSEATTDEEKEAAISAALQEYEKLSAADREKVKESYDRLQQYVNSLNGGDNSDVITEKSDAKIWIIIAIAGGAAIVIAAVAFAVFGKKKK